MMPSVETALACQDPDILWAYEGALGSGDTTEPIRAARATCQGCPVTVECLQHGLDTHARGVFGGRMLEIAQYADRPGYCRRGHDITGIHGRQHDDGHRSCLICSEERRHQRERRRAS